MSVDRKGFKSLTAGLSNPGQWDAKRTLILRQWLELLGGLPERVPVRFTRLSSTLEAAHTRHHIRYDTVYGDTVTAYLLIPHDKDSSRASGPLPAILALHPTANEGKSDIALPTGREDRRYALELVERGYVVLAPDCITAGERREEGTAFFHTEAFYARHPEWSAVGKMLADHLQGLDLLCSMPEVDIGRIGVIGHSLGGYNGYFLAGADDRIKAVAVSCGLSTFHGDPDPQRWGQRSWFTHLPQVTEAFVRDSQQLDFHEIAALVAPKPFFCWIAQQDAYMPHWKEIGEAAAELHELYALLGSGDRLQAVIGTSGHDFPKPVRDWTYNFLDRWLGREE